MISIFVGFLGIPKNASGRKEFFVRLAPRKILELEQGSLLRASASFVVESHWQMGELRNV
jgi:hypothetical protein